MKRIEELTQQISAAQERLEELHRLAEQLPEPHPALTAQALEELSTAMEELHVATEELYSQTEALTAVQQDLLAERQRYQELFEFAPDGYLVTDAKGNIQEANHAAAQLLGTPAKFLRGKPLALFVVHDQRKGFRTALGGMHDKQELPSHHWESTMQRQGQDPFPAALTVAPERDDQGKIRSLRWMLRDISAQKRSEIEIRHLATFIELTAHPVLELDYTGTVVYANPATILTLEQLGLEKDPRQFLPPDLLEILASAPQDQILQTSRELQLGGHTFVEQFIVMPQFKTVRVFAGDVTEPRQLEEEKQRFQERLFEAQKMESLGVLAGGIAHDFNNLLTGILGQANLALDDLPPGSSSHESVAQIRAAGLRAADLARQMLAYSGHGQFLTQPGELSAFVRQMHALLEAALDKRCSLQYRLAENLPAIECDSAQISQVIMNLVLNAAEAMEPKGGTITISTGLEERSIADLSAAYLGRGAGPGNYVYLEVGDTGAGMTPEVRGRIFEPFYSTKFTGRGLGLAVVAGIVQGLHGAVKVTSEPSFGTTVRVLFPALTATAVAAPVKPTPPAPAKPKAWRGSGTILVVDDEEIVRVLVRQILERAGFTVLMANDGFQGTEVFRAHADEIRLVLLDLTMPNMDGAEARAEMQKVRPEVPVLLSSGYSKQQSLEHFTGQTLAGFIRKPYDPHELLDTIREVLEP